MLRKLAAEALGTGLLMAVAVGSTLMGAQLTNDAALGLFFTSACAGLTLFVTITIFGPVSGGHLNPAVTLMALLRHELSRPAALGYGLAQVLGALVGAVLAHLMFNEPLLQISTIPRNLPSLWLSEAIATAGLIFVILGAIAAKAAVPALVGAYITAAYWFTASTGFANPAMTLARTLTGSGAGLQPADMPAYLLAQFTGAACGFFLATWLFAKEKPPA